MLSSRGGRFIAHIPPKDGLEPVNIKWPLHLFERYWARALIGVEAVTGGKILVNGQPASPRGVRQAKQKYRIGYVTENRKEEGLLLILDVATNIATTVWERLRQIHSPDLQRYARDIAPGRPCADHE